MYTLVAFWTESDELDWALGRIMRATEVLAQLLGDWTETWVKPNLMVPSVVALLDGPDDKG